MHSLRNLHYNKMLVMGHMGTPPHQVGKFSGTMASKEYGTLYVMFLLSSQMKGKLYWFFTPGKGCLFIGLAYQGKKDIVFRFIIEYSSLRDFDP
jgi:hypothetical protein